MSWRRWPIISGWGMSQLWRPLAAWRLYFCSEECRSGKQSSRVATFYLQSSCNNFSVEKLYRHQHPHFLYPCLNLLPHVSVSVRSINVTKSASQHDSQRLALVDLRCHIVWRDIIHPWGLFCETGLLCILKSVELACLWFWNKNKWRTLALVVLFNV